MSEQISSFPARLTGKGLFLGERLHRWGKSSHEVIYTLFSLTGFAGGPRAQSMAPLPRYGLRTGQVIVLPNRPP